ncbi:MAG: hypothetical protein JHC21_04220 [Thermocrinis sp.]|nr:hypothetical protein [Thermocrinis sp.]
MRITGELNNAELNIGKKGVGFNPAYQVPDFEDILNLISVEGNIQGKGSEISLNPAVPSEGSLEGQKQGKEVSRSGEDQKSNDFLINLPIFGLVVCGQVNQALSHLSPSVPHAALVVYGQINQAHEEEKVKADDVFLRADIDLPAEKRVGTSLVQFSSLEDKPQNTFTQPSTEANKEERGENSEFLVGFIVKPVEGKNAQVSNLFNVDKEYTQVEIPDIKINTARFLVKDSYQSIKSIENLTLSTGQNPQNSPNVNQANVDNGLKNDNVEPLLTPVLMNNLSKARDLKFLSHGFDNKVENAQKMTNIEQPYAAPVSKDSYTSVEKSVAKSTKLEIRDELQTKELTHRFSDDSELEFYPKEEYAKTELRSSSATIPLKAAKNVLEDLPQRVEKSELLPIEKSKKEEEHSHLYNMGISPQRFEDKIENVQEVKNTKHFHTFHDPKSLYVKLEEGDFRIRVVKDAISVKVDFREDFRPPTAQEVQNLIESLSKVGFRMEVLSLNGKNLQWEFRQGQEDKRGNRSREVSSYQGRNRQEFSLYL